MIAHVSGIPVEELVPLALASGTGGLLVVRVWLRMRIRARMNRDRAPAPDDKRIFAAPAQRSVR